MKIITVGSKKYLGEIEDKKITGIEVSDVNRNYLVKYIKDDTIGKLVEIVLSENTDYTYQELDSDLEEVYKKLLDIHAEAAEDSTAYLVNSIFEKLVNKYYD